ncbi:hypothetical protein C8R48DRAFT_757941 [Suillus tomentosus]|nr:hypothetical protein C8R48DRAFT_757941 [Suillus tomentosus]
MGAALYLVNNLSQPALPQAESSKSCSPNSGASSRYLSSSSQAKPAGHTFASRVLPPVAGYFVTPVRIALWPVTAILAFRAATSLDMCMEQPKLAFMNIDLQHAPLNGQTEPFIRVARRSSTDVPKRNLVLDAIDLGLYIPPETHPTSSGLAFVTSALVSGAIHSAMKSFSPGTFGSVDGGTIFDDSLSPHLRYLRLSIIATLCAFTIYSLIKANYEITVVICWLRRIIIFLGGNPLSLLFGRIGGVIGAFLVSRFIHHLTLLPFDPSSEMWRMMLPFGMMGTGMIIERAVSGNTTGDWMGWMWTMCWMLLWGNVTVDGPSVLDSATPIRQLIERLFDEYLPAIGRKP